MRKSFSKKDFLIIIPILVIGFIGMWFFNKNAKTGSSANYIATITYGDGNKIIVPLNSPQKIYIPDKPNVEIFVRDDHSIGFVHSDCPDKVCIRSGFLSKPGQNAACLPNKVMFIISDDESPDNNVDIAA